MPTVDRPRAKTTVLQVLTGLGTLAIGLGATPGCKPELGAPPSLIAGPQLLDIRSTPAEIKPGDSITLRGLIVDSTGTLAPAVAWTTCQTPKPPAESNAVSRTCVDQPDDAAPVSGSTTVIVPMDACTLFGPLAPPPEPGQPAVRPRDPDPTGGFYQPIRAAARGIAGADVDLIGFALVRVTCALANAPVDVARQFNDPVSGYHANLAPAFQVVTATDAAGTASTVTGTGARSTPIVPSGQSVTFSASWTPEVAETFPVFDIAARRLIDVRESLQVSWFATAGEFTHDRTGREGADPALSSDNTWRAPAVDSATAVHFWLVLRDNRGGSASAAFDLMVSP